jgi:magnesium-transporting ATPase (P-type)
MAKQQLPESAHKQTLVGDPLEIQLLEATGWHLDEPRDQAAGSGLGTADAQLLQNSSVVTSPHVSTMPYRLGNSDTAARREGWAASDGAAPRPLGLAIIKHYAFSSHKQRMAVLAAITPAPQEGSSGRPSPSPNNDKGVVYAYVKGAPERVRPLCSSDSVPADFSKVLQQYTRDGLRVLAVAGRRLEVSSWAEACDLPRNEVESQLVLLGLVVFQNKVKAATRPALTELHEANIRTLMITGDNLLTACSVARECGMVPDEAVFVQAAAWSHNEDGPAPPTAALLAANANATADGDAFTNGGDRLQIDARDWITADDLRHSSARRRHGAQHGRGWHYDHLGGGIYGPPGRWRRPGALEANNGYHHGSNGNSGAAYISNSGGGSVSDTSETSVDAGPFNGAPAQAVITRPGDCRLVLAPVDDLDTVLKADNEPHGVSLLKYPRLKDDVPPPAWMPPTRGSVVVAVTGKEFARIREQLPEDYRRLIVAGTVFARMAPDQKAQLVEDLIDLGFTTAMCGDGANDCSALKAAHVGLSLSEAEASVAAPFTSATPNITCVPTLIREGRAALVTSFACFKFMALYSFIEFASVLIAYYIDSNLGDFQFLYVDLILILVLAVLMSRTGAFHKLYPRRPPGRLVAFSILVSLLLQVTLHIATQSSALMLVKAQRWYVPLQPVPQNSNIKCYETTTVFCVSVFQYIAVAIGFSAGPPYRAPLIRNVPFLLAAALLTGINVVFLIYPPDFVEKLLQLQPLPDWRFRVTLLGMALGNAVLSISLETYLRSRSAQRLLSRLQGKRHYRNAYKNVARALLLDRWAYGAFCPGLDLAAHGGGGPAVTSKAVKPAKSTSSKKAKAVARAAQAARVEQAEAAAAAGAPPPAQPPQSILTKMPEEEPSSTSEA